jgi:hypothetical protein
MNQMTQILFSLALGTCCGSTIGYALARIFDENAGILGRLWYAYLMAMGITGIYFVITYGSRIWAVLG